MEQISLQEINHLPNLTPACAGFLCEASAVCLDNQNHKTGAILKITGDTKNEVELLWINHIDQKTKKNWADMQETTEFGATGIALLLSHKYTPYTVVERSAKGTGFDFYLGDKTEGRNFLANKCRLEVSGILNGRESQVEYRVRRKLEQTSPSDNSGLPAIIVVVEFSEPQAKMVNKNG